MRKPISKKLISLSLLVVIFSGLFLVNVSEARAGGLLEVAAKGILQGVSSFALHIAQIFTGFVGNIFTGMVTFGFQKMDMVRFGWTICRDIVNMFFILGLIVIAFATILKIETYGIKALLPKLIIIALLINFSYLICGFIIDGTQIAATYFVNQIGTEDIAIAVLSRLKVVDAIRGVEGMRVAITDYDTDMVVILTMSFSAIVIFLAGFVMLVGAILLFIRVGALWALIILSPFAWFFGIFPGKLKGYANQWWEKFLTYAFFAPIYVFFIFLVLKISEAGVLEGMGLATGETAVGLGSLTLVPIFGDLNLLFRYVFLIVLLFGAPTIAMSMGVKGAGAAQSFVKGGLKGTGRIAGKLTYKPAWKGVKAAARKFDRSVLAPVGISPKAIKEGWKRRKEEKERRAYEPAILKWMDKFNKLPGFGREKTFNENKARDLLVDQERVDLRKQFLGKEELADIANESKKAGRTDRYEAAMLELVSRGDEEAIFEHAELGKDYNHETSAENWQKLIQDTISDEQEQIRFAGKLQALAKMSALPYIDGISKYDSKKHKQVWTTKDEIGQRGGTEAMKMSPRDRWQLLNRRNYLSMDESGNPKTVTNAMKVMLRQLSSVDAKHAVERMSSVNKNYLVKGEVALRTEIGTITDSNQRKVAEDWLNDIKKSIPSQPKPVPPGVTTA